MTESVDPKDYPLPLGALKYLCGHYEFLDFRRACVRWRNAALTLGLHPTSCSKESVAYANEAKARRTKTFAGWIDHRSDLPKFTHEFGEAMHALTACSRRRQTSYFDRLRNGEIKILAREQADPGSLWFVFEPDRVQERDFILGDKSSIVFNSRNLKEQKKFDARLRDSVGVSLDQAVYIYGDVQIRGRLRLIDQCGTLGPLNLAQLPPSAPADIIEKAPTRYRDEFLLASAALVDQLRDGSLIGVRGGDILPRKFWNEIDTSTAPEGWCPAALIRFPTTAERGAEDLRSLPDSEQKQTGGRPTMMPKILEEYLARYTRPNGQFEPPMPSIAAGTLFKWAEVNWKQLGVKGEVSKVETIATRIREFYRWLKDQERLVFSLEQGWRAELVSRYWADWSKKNAAEETNKP